MNDNRVTMPILTKYEKARIIGSRAAQIASNSVIYISLEWDQLKEMTSIQIAEMELARKAIPFSIRRFMPDRTYEEWTIN